MKLLKSKISNLEEALYIILVIKYPMIKKVMYSCIQKKKGIIEAVEIA